ncbi:L-threonylcarbamoyladenylate synthase [Pseudidiomarina sp. E22-M8]|uniref:L-threonylcarbamoyladenylate synthase n=1 Tax=Pseudidiomarina sp. E22-M8 TaxID=3424768 RepID=UPI00403C9CD9
MNWQPAKAAFTNGELLAYPTEAVFGLGCDPRNEAAVMKLLTLKQRPVEKGLILVAADYSQLVRFVADLEIPQDKRFSVFSHWPGAITLLLPAAADTPDWLTGGRRQIAVRVTAHEPTRQLCKALGSAIVSTSANLSGEPSLTTATEVRNAFADQLGWIMDAEVGGASSPSKIIDPFTQEVVRA